MIATTMTKSPMSIAKTSPEAEAMTKSSPKAVAKESPSQHSRTKTRPRVSSAISTVSSSTVLYNYSCISSTLALLITLPWVATTSASTSVSTRRPRGPMAMIGSRWSSWIARGCRGWRSRARGLVRGWMDRLRGVGLRRIIR